MHKKKNSSLEHSFFTPICIEKYFPMQEKQTTYLSQPFQALAFGLGLKLGLNKQLCRLNFLDSNAQCNNSRFMTNDLP